MGPTRASPAPHLALIYGSDASPFQTFFFPAPLLNCINKLNSIYYTHICTHTRSLSLFWLLKSLETKKHSKLKAQKTVPFSFLPSSWILYTARGREARIQNGHTESSFLVLLLNDVVFGQAPCIHHRFLLYLLLFSRSYKRAKEASTSL